MFNKTTQKKVFCKYCRYVDTTTRIVANCEHPNNKRERHNYFETWVEHIRKPEKINKHNNCKTYRRV